jgi:hypothetical protein
MTPPSALNVQEDSARTHKHCCVKGYAEWEQLKRVPILPKDLPENASEQQQKMHRRKLLIQRETLDCLVHSRLDTAIGLQYCSKYPYGYTHTVLLLCVSVRGYPRKGGTGLSVHSVMKRTRDWLKTKPSKFWSSPR